jgi:PAS domain S-box-containing protein
MGIFSTKGKKSKEGPDSDKKKKQLLQEFELKYHKLIDTANYAIFIADAKTGFILDANKKAGELIGVSPDRIIGMHQSKLHPPEEAKRYNKIFQEHIKSGKAISEDLFVINKSGEKIPVEISASIVEIGGKKIIQGIFRDVTERKKAEDTVKKIKETLNTFMNSAPDVFALFDSELNLVDVNRAGLMMLPQGTKKEDVIGKKSLWRLARV